MPFALILQIRMEELGLVVNLLPIGRLGAGDVRRACVNFRFVLAFVVFAVVTTFIVDLWDCWDRD